ncbi:MAG: septal ring lytic transglycosylase RlpA family protein [Bacteroidaceae bacterium]|nr:septal ring lytic transglycosylase RlpA family protein [Bacteroidaceae bacterium]
MKNYFILTAVMLLVATGAFAQDTIRGRASYYSDRFEGRRMAGGGVYRKDSMTCAHRRLPFGTLLKVRNLRNDKEVIVKVTDRGPFAKRFIIDLSRAAATQLDFIRAGHTPVEVTRVEAKCDSVETKK